MTFNFYGNWYESVGAGKCRFWYSFGITWFHQSELDRKLFGYWQIYYDGPFHFFNIWPLTFSWLKRPITEETYNAMNSKNLND